MNFECLLKVSRVRETTEEPHILWLHAPLHPPLKSSAEVAWQGAVIFERWRRAKTVNGPEKEMDLLIAQKKWNEQENTRVTQGTERITLFLSPRTILEQTQSSSRCTYFPLGCTATVTDICKQLSHRSRAGHFIQPY